MNLPFLKSNNKPQKNYFFALLIKPFKVGAILFEEENGKLLILASKEIDSPQEIDSLEAADLLVIADRAISSVEPASPSGVTVDKTIFSLPYDWVSEGKIKQDYLAKLKKLCEDLGLTPMGYLISIEAIVHYLQSKEGAPISAIFVENYETKIILYLVKGGKIIEFLSGQIKDGNSIMTVENLLRGIDSVDVLPSKIVLLNHKGAASTEQEFISYSWPSDISFLHLPQVITLKEEVENEATVKGVASQMELQVDGKIGSAAASTIDDDSDAVSDSGNFGFLKEKDILDVEDKVVVPHDKPLNKDNLDFEFNDEVKHEITNIKKEEEYQNVSEGDQEDEKSSISPLSVLASFAGKLKIPKFPFVGGASGNLMKIRIIAGLVILVIFGVVLSFSYYNFLLTANIMIASEESVIEEEMDVEFAVDAAGDQIEIEIVSEEVSGEETKNATGELETGEKAKGEVTISSSLGSTQTIEAGTILSAGSLEFVLDSDVRIASSSGVTDIKTAKGKVTAAEIGREYNLPSGTKFAVEGYSSSSLEAKNDTALSGGTKEEKTVVSESDLNQLLSTITEKMESEAISLISNKLTDDEGILEQVLSSEIVDHKFDRKAGDEASSVSINATIRYSLGKYNKDNIVRKVADLSNTEIPDNYSLVGNNSNVNISDLEVANDSETASAKLSVNAVFAPEIDSNIISERVIGKSKNYATDEIGKISGVRDVSITFENAFPVFPEILPNNIKNIKIEFKND